MGTFEGFMDGLYFRQLPGGNAYNEPGSDNAEEEDCFYCQVKCRRPPGTTPSTPFKLLTPEEDAELEGYITKCTVVSKILLNVLADRYDVPELRKEIVDWEYHNLVGSIIHGLPWNAEYIQGLRNLPTTSPMIRFMIDLYVDRHNMITDRDACGTETLLRQKLSPEFLVAVIDGYAASKGTEAKKAVKQLCAYHEHNQEEKTIEEYIEVQKKESKRQHRNLEVGENSMNEAWGPEIGETNESDDLFIEEPA